MRVKSECGLPVQWTAYTQTWRGEMPMRAAEGPMYEYACHEGNHSLGNILRGARYEEKTR